MSHPIEQLVDLVDGALPERERAVVLAHVGTCSRCRAEVAAATAGRDALAQMGAPSIPAGLGDRAIAESRRVAENHDDSIASARASQQRWYRVAAGAGVAAVLVLAIALALPQVGDRTTSTVAAEAGAGAEDAAIPPAATSVEVLDRDFDLDTVRELTDGVLEPASVPVTSQVSADAEITSEATVKQAVGCLRSAFAGGLPGDPIRLISARFKGEPAYLGVFAVGPGADQPADELQVKVAEIDGCRAVSDSRFEL